MHTFRWCIAHLRCCSLGVITHTHTHTLSLSHTHTQQVEALVVLLAQLTKLTASRGGVKQAQWQRLEELLARDERKVCVVCAGLHVCVRM